MSWQRALQELGSLRGFVPLSEHTTLAVGGSARWYFKPYDRAALVEGMALIPLDIPLLPLGRGSNLLISDVGFQGLVLDLGSLQAVRCDGTSWEAEAGCRMSKIAQSAAIHGCTGLEFMATVPGDLGGGIAMNAGAFGQQVSDVLYEVEVLHRDGVCQKLPREALDMRYRYTALPQGSVVLSAQFVLQRDSSEVVKARMREMRQKRSQSQPLALANCGSVFKNPEGDYAARLIEAVGLKGHRLGGAQISDLHANFIVNHGDARASDVMALMALAQKRVWEQFQIRLEPEVRVLQGDTYV